MAVRIFTPCRNRERIYNHEFSKVNTLRKRKSGAYSQEESCLKFIQAEGNIKALLVTLNTNIASNGAPFLTHNISNLLFIG